MTLTLTIEGAEILDNAQPVRIELRQHGAVIGRSPHADWCLPDNRKIISSRHCEISYRDGRYILNDLSTNGTYLNGSAARLTAAHPMASGDTIEIGDYRIRVSGADGSDGVSPLPVGGYLWESVAPPLPRPQALDARWAEPPSPGGIAPRRTGGDVRGTPVAGVWDFPAPLSSSSAWSSAPSQLEAPAASDVWGRLAHESEIDWSRGNFASPAPRADAPPGAPPPLGTADDLGDVSAPAIHAVPPVPAGNAPAPRSDRGGANFLEACGLAGENFHRAPDEVAAGSGALLRQLVGGLVLMMEARARAKAQLGVSATGLELDGNNPLKFIRSTDAALKQLLDEPARGFMPARRAIEDAFEDLQAHQMATLGAMRGALAGALARFSPAAIRGRHTPSGRLARWFPALRDALNWRAYERDFEGVLRDSDDAFMDVFAQEFQSAYARHIADMKRHRDNTRA